MGNPSRVWTNVTVDGKIRLMVGSEISELSAEQVDRLIQRLTTAKSDAKELKETQSQVSIIKSKYNDVGKALDEDDNLAIDNAKPSQAA